MIPTLASIPHTGGMPDQAQFSVVLRGYDPQEVDAVVQQVQGALATGDPGERAEVRRILQNLQFNVRLRGFDRVQVDTYMRQALVQLDAAPPPTLDEQGRPEPPPAGDEVATLLGFLD